MSVYRIYFASSLVFLAVSGLTGCFEKNVETRERMAPGHGKVTLAEDMKETGDYDYHRDNVWRAGYMDRLENSRKERRRQQMVDSQLRDGTLLDKY